MACKLLCAVLAGTFLLSTGDDHETVPERSTFEDNIDEYMDDQQVEAYDTVPDPAQKAFEDNIANYMDDGQEVKTFDGKDYYGRLGLVDRTYCHCIFGDDDVEQRGRCFGKIATIFAKCAKAGMEEACDRKIRKMIDSCKEDACNVDECKDASRPFGAFLSDESAFDKPNLRRKSKPAIMLA